MKSLWLTYAWADNNGSDVDFVAQELGKAGINVKLDRWNLASGKPLWDQIESFICDATKSDAWLFYATQSSLSSQACREEFRYALDRALHMRGNVFPLIALFPASVERDLIPAAIKTRLFVSLTDPDWKERILSSVNDTAPDIARIDLSPYVLTIHNLDAQNYGEQRYAIEVRPRAGVWAPMMIGIPVDEKDAVKAEIHSGPIGQIPDGWVRMGLREGISGDGKWYMLGIQNTASPVESCFALCNELPTSLIFGAWATSPQYKVEF